jgi:adenine-specific DNA-methyltransferase
MAIALTRTALSCFALSPVPGLRPPGFHRISRALGMSVRVEQIGDATLYLARCEDVLPTLSGMDAVITDPPYHGVKREAWDNQWKTDADFLAWGGSICQLIHGVTEPSASLYWFASPQMASRLEIVIGERFRVLNNIVWDKSGGRKGVGGSGIDVTALRGFWSANTERIIFAEHFGADSAAKGESGYVAKCDELRGFVFEPLRAYLDGERKRAGIDKADCNAACGFSRSAGGMASRHYFSRSQWALPTEAHYRALQELFNRNGGEYLRREYEHLRREYEHLRREYEHLRRPFFLSPEDEWGDVWRFGIERGSEHPTQKPIALMRHIVKVSSRPGHIIIDPFTGSGTTGVACMHLGRRFVGIERDPKYFSIACRRIEEAQRQGDLIRDVLPKPKAEQGGLAL